MGHNMRITDLLDKNSISLNAAPADKKETLDLAVELMAKSGKLSDVRSIVNRSMQERKRVPRESERELRSLTENVMR